MSLVDGVGPSGKLEGRLASFVFALAVFAWLAAAIGTRPLILPDEARYVGVAWEMVRSGEWMIPTENGLPFFHKPPLFFWLVGMCIKVFGSHPAAARLPSMAAAFAAVMGLHAVLRRRIGTARARATVCVLVTMPFFFGAAQFANLDILVASFIALAIVFGADAAMAVMRGEPSRRSLLIAWACAGLGVLAKGLIGVLLPGLVLLIWLLITGQGRALTRLLWWPALMVFALVAGPWFIVVQNRYPGFARYFFVHHHFQRFAGEGFNNAQPWWFYLVAVPLLTLPWSLWLFRTRWRAAACIPEVTLLRHLSWTWLGVVVLFFSVPQSKPVGYAVPALFPMAVLVAMPVLELWQGRRRREIIGIFASAMLATLACVAGVLWEAIRYDRDHKPIAMALRQLRQPREPVVFLGNFFFDVPFYAGLRESVVVVADWDPGRVAEHDNWRRELADAGRFAPETSSTLLVGSMGEIPRQCGFGSTWVLAQVADEAPLHSIPDARRVELSRGVGLWQIASLPCADQASAAAALP